MGTRLSRHVGMRPQPMLQVMRQGSCFTCLRIVTRKDIAFRDSARSDRLVGQRCRVTDMKLVAPRWLRGCSGKHHRAHRFTDSTQGPSQISTWTHATFVLRTISHTQRSGDLGADYDLEQVAEEGVSGLAHDSGQLGLQAKVQMKVPCKQIAVEEVLCVAALHTERRTEEPPADIRDSGG